MSIQYTKQTQPRGVGKSLFTALAIFFASIVAVVGGANVQPANAAAMNGFTQVSTGTQFTCAVKSDGTVWCWGYNNVGQLGNGTTTNASRPVQVTGLTNATQVASADTASCALKSDGTVWCWGGGRLGNGSAAGSTVPVQVSDLTTAIQISGKFQHFCALKSDQNVVCWGWNALNIMGDSTGTDRLVPTAPNPALPMGVVQVSSGVFGTSVLLSDGTVRSWGAGNNGALGNGSTTYSTSTKTAPTGLSTVSKISGGPGWGNLCAIETAGSVVKCWGLNNNGQLGIGVAAASGADYWRLTPVVVSGFTSTVTAIDVGIYTPCAVLADTSLMCWGYNGEGQAGVSGTQVLTPTAVPNMTGVSQVSPGYYHSCAVLGDTTVKCWGRNTYGALGNNTTTNSVAAVSVLAPPTTLSTPTSVTATATASTEKSIDVSWDASTGASSYTVKIYNAAGASVLGTKTSVTGTSTTITASTYSAIAHNTAYKITVTAIGDAGVNYNNSAESAQASVTTNPPNLVISTPTSGLSGTANSAYSLTVAGSGGIAPLTYALTGTLVAGLNFNTSTGVISGTPNVSGSQIFSVTMTDSRSVSVSTANFTIAIASATTTVSIALADATPTYGVTNRITATTSQAGTVNFKAGSATISGCGAVTATSTAICDWVPSSVGSVALTAVLTPTASGTYSGSTSSALNKTVALATQAGLTLTSTSGTYGTDLTLAATGGSGGGALSYVVTTAGTAGCSILSGNLLSATAPGTCTVTATRAASTNYLVQSSTATTVTFARQTQAALNVSTVTGDIFTGIIVSSSGGSGTGAVTYGVTTGTANCALTSGVVTARTVGTCLLTVTKAADTYYLAASESFTLSFGKAIPISGQLSTPTTGTAGTEITLSFTGGSGTGAVTYAVLTPGTAKCVITNGKLVASASGSCTVTTTKLGDDTYPDQVVTTEFTFAAGQNAVPTVSGETTTTITPATTTTTVVAGKNGKKTSVSTTTTTPTTTTTTTSTTVAASSSELQPAPELVNTASAQGAATIGGKTAKATTARVNNQLIFTAAEFTVTFAGVNADGSVIPLRADGVLELAREDMFRLDAKGFAPGTEVIVWMFSQPQRLAKLTVGADGLVRTSLRVPKSLKDGLHHVVLVGVDQNKKEAKFEFGLNVGVPADQWWVSRVLLVIPISIAVFIGLWLPTSVRRRRNRLI
jgi:alpha-tubulin suppressor-like RCC1 family protein